MPPSAERAERPWAVSMLRDSVVSQWWLRLHPKMINEDGETLFRKEWRLKPEVQPIAMAFIVHGGLCFSAITHIESWRALFAI
jgi:hypothetical protein